MPHHFINRPRALARGRKPTDPVNRRWEAINSTSYVIGGALFVWGSVLFFPALSAKANEGAWIFLVGSLLYLLVTGHDAIEVARHRRQIMRRREPVTVWDRLETWAAASYLLGTVLFLVGSAFYLQRIDLVEAGTWLFIVGSALFVLGATIDVLQIVRVPRLRILQLTNLTAITFVTGSVLFLVASVPYLFPLATSDDARLVDAMSAAQYVVGSVLFLLGGLINYRRTTLVTRGGAVEALGAEERAGGV